MRLVDARVVDVVTARGRSGDVHGPPVSDFELCAAPAFVPARASKYFEKNIEK